MKILARITLLASASLICLATAATASADRVYYLVGVRHVYRIGHDKYFHADERRQIEQDYADQVSADNSHYQYAINHGSDPNVEGPQLDSALHDLAAERETRLGSLYERCDWVRERHPSFNITVDGPYQVIGVGYHVYQNAEYWDNYVAYAPWPGYVCEGPNPYGWNYGVVYAPGLFVSCYHGWYGGWVGFGSPAFVGFYGYGGPIVCAGLSIHIGGGFGFSYYSNPGLGGYYHAGPGYFARDAFRGGYIAGRRDARFAMARRAGYEAGFNAIRSARSAGYASGIRAGARSTFSSSTRGSSTSFAYGVNRGGSFSHTAPPVRTGSSYSHSTTGNRVGSFNRSANTVRPGSSYSHTQVRSTSGSTYNRTGSFRPSTPTRSSGSSSPSPSRYGHSSGSFRPSGSRPSGSFGHSSPGRSSGSFGRPSTPASHGSFGGSRPSGGGRSSGSGGGGRKRGG